MKIEFFEWKNMKDWTGQGHWSVLVDNEVIGSVQLKMLVQSSLGFFPSIKLDNNFPPTQCAEIEKAVADFITIQRVTKRLTS